MSQANPFPKKLVIVGGGTAGWMTATLLEHAWSKHGCEITVVESDQIETIGVGEGSTPSLKLFFQALNIPEQEWMPKCNATYKVGISFPNWTEHMQNNAYFHPFYSEHDIKTGLAFIHNANLRRQGFDIPVHPDNFWLQTKLAQLYKSPQLKKPQTEELDYGYHFDSALLGQFLKQRAIKRGVKHHLNTVSSVNLDDKGDISSLTLLDGKKLEAEFFVDCTGFAALLISKTLKVNFESFSKELFNDRAVAFPSPPICSDKLPTQTTSTALKNGWAWSIPLSNRIGNGYVYSSKYCSDEEALSELKSHLGIKPEQHVEARFIKMRLGRVTKHWHKNVLAVGLSQGFIEPLEATALATMQYTIEHFIECYPLAQKHKSADEQLPGVKHSFNNEINAVIDSVKDYIVCHYRLNSRTDSQYWRDNRSNLNHSDNVNTLLKSWRQPDTDFESKLTEVKGEKMYFSPSWYCLFAGKGAFNDANKPLTTDIRVAPTEQVDQYCLSQAQHFLDHKTQLDLVYGDCWPNSYEWP